MSAIGLRKAARVKAIHAACRAAGIDDDERHRLQRQITGKASLTEMSYAEVNAVLDHLNRAGGWQGHAGKPRGIADDPQLQKIEALLADMKLPWAYLHKGQVDRPSMVRRLTGKDRIEWADAIGKQAVIVALVKRQQKVAGG
jgi:phage gp16-like protein